MKKTAQLVCDHLKGIKTAASMKAMKEVSDKLKEAGFKPPFKVKTAQYSDVAEFNIIIKRIARFLQSNMEMTWKSENYRIDGDPAFEPFYNEKDLEQYGLKVIKRIKGSLIKFINLFESNPNQKYQKLYELFKFSIESDQNNDDDITTSHGISEMMREIDAVHPSSGLMNAYDNYGNRFLSQKEEFDFLSNRKKEFELGKKDKEDKKDIYEQDPGDYMYGGDEYKRGRL